MSDLTRRSILKLGSALIAGGFSQLRVSAQNALSNLAYKSVVRQRARRSTHELGSVQPQIFKQKNGPRAMHASNVKMVTLSPSSMSHPARPSPPAPTAELAGQLDCLFVDVCRAVRSHHDRDHRTAGKRCTIITKTIYY